MIFSFAQCTTHSVSQREVEIYQTLRETADKQRGDLDFFMKHLPRSTSDDSLIVQHLSIQKAAAAVAQQLLTLEQMLIMQVGKGKNPKTQLPNRLIAIKATQQLLVAHIKPLEQVLKRHVQHLKSIGKNVPLPDLKVWKGDLYQTSFEQATLLRSITMLQQIRCDVWYNANLLSQRVSS